MVLKIIIYNKFIKINYKIHYIIIFISTIYILEKIRKFKQVRKVLYHIPGVEDILTSFNSALLLEPQDTLKEDNTNYKVFTAFYKKNYLQGNSKIRLPIAKPPNLNLLKIESLSLTDLSLIPKIKWYKNFESICFYSLR